MSGMRPTGRLHLGHLVGALQNWVQLEQQYDCFYFVADWHVLTTEPADSGAAPAYTVEMIADWLGAGLDPERSTLFIQSLIPEHAELHLMFSMVTPAGVSIVALRFETRSDPRRSLPVITTYDEHVDVAGGAGGTGSPVNPIAVL